MICYVLLEDVATSDFYNAVGENLDRLPQSFRDSRWFTRGWTLQELIAPRIVKFYTNSWHEIGTKASLREYLYQITGIDLGVIDGEDPALCNVAERMSWAARRKTTRVEDGAYCLLGISNVSMPFSMARRRKPSYDFKRKYCERLMIIHFLLEARAVSIFQIIILYH
jgi:hypothetical protein